MRKGAQHAAGRRAGATICQASASAAKRPPQVLAVGGVVWCAELCGAHVRPRWVWEVRAKTRVAGVECGVQSAWLARVAGEGI